MSYNDMLLPRGPFQTVCRCPHPKPQRLVLWSDEPGDMADYRPGDAVQCGACGLPLLSTLSL